MKYLFIILLIFGARNIKSQDQTKRTEKLTKHFRRYLKPNGDKPVVNILAYLKNEEQNYTFHQGFGWIELAQKKDVEKNQTFKIASITKMFTSVVILQLMEENKIDLDEPVYTYLNDLEFVRFDSLHIFDNKTYGKQITIRQLLSHRSGLADLFVDAEHRFNAYEIAHKQEKWTPKKLFAKYYEYNVNKMAKFKPGESFAYTDVGYFLLGLCIERITGTSLAKQYRKRIIEPLDMDYTYFEYHDEPVKKIEQAHAFLGEMDATAELNTSYDWAGGGLVSNTYDLSVFIESLFENKLFQKSQSLELMVDKKMYGYGISIFTFDKKEYFGHLGFWGSGVIYDPMNGNTIVLSINQVHPPFNSMKFVKKVIKILEESKK